ncbi:contractile injection system protein, VgrG/Pvc8 family, partial [Maridesulfovibrio hydrothermalis]|uniref:contractile injection system protein, VgrG/Pvc8 family n=1 Tax=Maridesulfovibrio hydrothermalis TaxID=191026 RepID=UPI0004894106
MQPVFKILADSKDVTAKIADRLIRLTVTDEAGQTSDAVEIELDNRDGAIAVPRTGAELEVFMGYSESGMKRMGLFTAGDITLSGPPDSLTIQGHAANMRISLKAPHTKSWDQKTISDIVSTIAAEHGLIPVVGSDCGGVLLEHIDQTEESDLHFLTRLAKDHDAVAKPVENR